MKASRDLKPLFIRKEEIPDGGVIVTIAQAERRDMSTVVDEQDFQWLLTFREGWRLRLNQPNLHKIIELCGDETELWPGKRLGLRLAEFKTKEGGTNDYIKIVPAPEIALKRKPPLKRKPLEEPPGGESLPDSDESLFA
jgi:hypothetical protein